MKRYGRGQPSANEAVLVAMDAAIAAGDEIGLQVCAYLDGECVIDAWAGSADSVSDRAVDGDTLFNVFSVAKAVAATALHIQADRGLVDYDAPIARYWPEFAANGKEHALVRHGLTHRIGIPQMPLGVTPELMADWDWMVKGVAALEPLFPVGERTAYQCLTFGWIIGEIVRRTDPKKRSFRDFVLEEIAAPLKLSDLWIGLPEGVEHRIARLTNANAGDPPPPGTTLFAASIPPAVALIPEVFERPEIRRACIPGVGGIFNARSEARFFAMLAQGGELDGVRLLSKERVARFSTPRANSDEPDPVLFGYPLNISVGGYWLGGQHVKNPRAFWHPGAGGSLGWADPDAKLAVAICHNRMFQPGPADKDPIVPIADAVRSALNLA